MTPQEPRRKMAVLGDQGAQDEKHWYRLVNSVYAEELRKRQELLRSQMTPQVIAQCHHRLHSVPGPYEARFIDRELVASEAHQMGVHLVPPLPPHSSVVSSRGFPRAGDYGFLPTESIESLARQQDLFHKQNIARMKVNAVIHQKELENVPHKGLEGMMFQGVQPNTMDFGGQQCLSGGHDIFVHHTRMDDLQANRLFISTSPYPPITTLQREKGRRIGRRTSNHKSSDTSPTCMKSQSEQKSVKQSPEGALGEEKETEWKRDLCNESATGKSHQDKMNTELSANVGKRSYEGEHRHRKACTSQQAGCPEGLRCNTASSEKDKANTCSTFHKRFLYPSMVGPLTGISYMFPLSVHGSLNSGQTGLSGGEISSVEDIHQWTVDDVCNFISDITSCSEYAQTFKEHMIDGETLPLLTEEHLLEILGLKLGPALKIRSQLLRRLGNMFRVRSAPLDASAGQVCVEKTDDGPSGLSSLPDCHSVEQINTVFKEVPGAPKPAGAAPAL